MAPSTIFGPSAKIAFHQSPSPNVVANRVRFHAVGTTPDLTMPFDEVRPQPAPDSDGFTRIALSALPKASTIDGETDIAVTAVDAAGNESPFLDIIDVDLDMVPPQAPTDGSVEA